MPRIIGCTLNRVKPAPRLRVLLSAGGSAVPHRYYGTFVLKVEVVRMDGRLARGAARRDLLLRAAARVVAGRGSAALTHRAVAAEAGVSLASVTYHFASAADLHRAMFEHVGSAIGLELAALVADAAHDVAAVPAICADYAVRLASERLVETAAVFEMIVAAGHDAGLRPVARFFQDRLTDLFLPYTGDEAAARTAGAAVQGLLLTAVMTGEHGALWGAVEDLIRRYRRRERTDY
jgi:TetR/AcrR family transcriptional regulator, regulator of biofilm formation and stress response